MFDYFTHSLYTVIKRIGHKCFYLPQRTSTEFPYPSYQRGGLNPLPINVVTDITQRVHGLGLLQSAHLGYRGFPKGLINSIKHTHTK